MNGNQAACDFYLFGVGFETLYTEHFQKCRYQCKLQMIGCRRSKAISVWVVALAAACH